MVEPVQILWTPAGVSMPDLGAKGLIDYTDGDTPNIRMPVRMLSVDTPEVTARSEEGAARVDLKLAELAGWLADPATRKKLPISDRYATYLVPKLADAAGTRQFEQGKEASAFSKANTDKRLTRDNGRRRNLFVRVADQPFDDNGRLLAYIAPNYSAKERENLTREERSTFNLDLVRAGWAAPFVIYPSIPGELDLPLLVAAVYEAMDAAAAGDENIWSDPKTLLAYEYRAAEKLHGIAAELLAGKQVRDRFGWRQRYCADMRTRLLYGPEDYIDVHPAYRLWLWPDSVAEAVSRLNLVPSPRLGGGA